MRKILFQVHLWIGLILCVPLVLLGVTGSLLVFEHDLNDMLQPHKEIHASAGAPQSLDAIAKAALEGAPKGWKVTLINLPEHAGDAAELRIGKGGGGRPKPGNSETVSVDPVSLEILNREGGANPSVLRPVKQLHANLLMDGRQGREIIGWLGVAMLTLGISGLVLWWPKRGGWSRAFWVKKGVEGYRFHRDLHGSVGFWGLAVFVLVTFSGVYLAFPQPLAKAIVAVAPGKDLRSTVQAIKVDAPKGAKPISFDAMADAARKQAPDSRLMSISPGGKKDQPTRLGLAHPGWEEGAPFVTVYLDPYTGAVLETRDPRTYTAGETAQAWQHALHAGEGLGIVWKLLVFLSGILPLLFSITGVTMWLIKRKQKNGNGEASAAK